MGERAEFIKPSALFGVDKIIDVSVENGNGVMRCYKVQWKPTWLSEYHLIGCERLIEDFLLQKTKTRADTITSNIDKTIQTGSSNSNIESLSQKSGAELVASDQPDVIFKEELHEDVETIEIIPQNTQENGYMGNFSHDSGTPSMAFLRHNEHENHRRKDVSFSERTLVKTHFDFAKSNVTNPSSYSYTEQNRNTAYRGADQNVYPKSSDIVDGNQSAINGSSNEIIPVRSDSESESVFDKKAFSRNYNSNNVPGGLIMDRQQLLDYQHQKYAPLENNNKRSSVPPVKPPSSSSGEAFPCTICGKDFKHRGNLKRHLRFHSGDRQFKCTTCGHQFYQHSDLVRHLRKHTGERPFKCTICEKWFKRKPNLTKHMMLHEREAASLASQVQLDRKYIPSLDYT